MRLMCQCRRAPVLRAFRRTWAAICLAAAFAFAPTSPADDLQTVAANVAANILSGTPSASGVLANLAKLNADGSFSDVDYADQTSTNWKTATHLSRLRDMAKAYTDPKSTLYHNEASLPLAKVLSAYDYWVSHDFQNPNWWYNEINTPNVLSDAMVLLQRDGSLSSARLTSGLTLVARSYQARTVNSGTNTGENRVWRANASINRAVLSNDASLVSESFGAVADTLVKSTAEGIQPDNSFHQHGAQLYGGGYGMGFGSDVARIASEAAGTAYAVPLAKQQILVDYLLDGQQWFTRGDTYDLTAMGREVGRPNPKDRALSLSAAVTKAMTLGSYRQAELQAMNDRLAAARSTHAADPAKSLSGNRDFWTSDVMVQQRPGYYASVKLNSTRTRQPELINNENIKGLHLYDGVNLILRTGNEYDDIQPVWDWYRLPGTTTERGTYSLKPSNTSGTSTYAGGVSDGSYGASAFKFSRGNVSAKKAWFFFDNEFVALGSDINAPNATAPVATSVNQSRLNTAVTYKTTGATGPLTLTSGSSVTPANLSWVNQDSIGYFFPQPLSTATLSAKPQSGSWTDLNPSYASTPSTLDVFSLDLAHGNKPSKATYAYIVVPGLTATEMDAYAAANPISILRNDATVQAVRQNALGITQAAFYAADSLAVRPGLMLTQVTANVGSTVMLQEKPGQLVLSVASPEALATSLQLRITEQLQGPGATWSASLGYTTLQFTLPSGTAAGSTLVQTYTVVPEPSALLAATAVPALLLARRRRPRRNA